jgi:Ca2+/Na+ antiporter
MNRFILDVMYLVFFLIGILLLITAMQKQMFLHTILSLVVILFASFLYKSPSLEKTKADKKDKPKPNNTNKSKHSSKIARVQNKLFTKFLKLFKRSPKTDEDILVDEINEVLLQERSLKKQERKLQKRIEKLYSRSLTLVTVEHDSHKQVSSAKQRMNSNQTSVKETAINDDIKHVLKLTDDLLGNLPEERINEFAKSKDFEKYKKVMEQLNKK